MPTSISRFAEVDPRAQIGQDVQIGPFCVIGPDVVLGDRCRLDSHVNIIGHTSVGNDNRFHAHAVIGDEPQDLGYRNEPTQVIIGHNNTFREGVTVHRGANKEDGTTRIGNHCTLLSNAHVGHNCWVHDHVMLVNGVLLGGHCHVEDRATISGNTVVHQFTSVGKLAFVSGGCRVTADVPPFMLWFGSEKPGVVSVNLVGMKRSGMPESTVSLIRHAFKLIFRARTPLDVAQKQLLEECGGLLPEELSYLLNFLDLQTKGKVGRGREAIRNQPSPASASGEQRRAA